MQTNLAGTCCDARYLKCTLITKETTAFGRKLSFLLFSALLTLRFSLFSKEAVVSEKSEERRVKKSGIRFADDWYEISKPVNKDKRKIKAGQI